MILPLPDEKLWRWMMPAPKPSEKTIIGDETHGL